jgi:uncharacterized RDD family membrane protein YckC
MTTAVAPAALVAPRQRTRAGIASRLAADGIDFVLVQLVFALALLGYSFARFLLTDKPFELPHPPVWGTSTLLFLLFTAYLAWGWASTGRTLGKALLGLRVGTDDGRPLSIPRAIARAALCTLVGPILLAWAVVSRKNAGIHDLLLGTAVVYDWVPRTSARSPAAARL